MKKFSDFIEDIISNLFQSRDRIYIKNVILTLFLQSLSFLITILITPLALGYLDQERYGLWLVITSICGWIGYFNLGLGGGLRLKLIESLALKDYDISKKYVSTVYFIIAIIAAVIILLFLAIHSLTDWTGLLNATEIYRDDINGAFLLCAVAVILRLVLSLILTILEADQKIGYTKIFPLLSNIFIIIALVFFRQYSASSILLLASATFIPELIIYFFTNVFFFKTRYQNISPSIKKIHTPFAGELMKIGLKFFIIQIAIIILFSTDNIILTRLFGPSIVAPYNISLQYMGFASSLFYLVLAPSIAAFKEAHTKNDFIWIRLTIRRLLFVWFSLCIVLFILVFLSPVLYNLWIGDRVAIPRSMTILMAIYTAISCWNSLFGSFNTGIGKLNLTAVICFIITIINIPLSVFLAGTLQLGANGVILASIACLLLGAVFSPVQAYRLLTGKAKGIWDK